MMSEALPHARIASSPWFGTSPQWQVSAAFRARLKTRDDSGSYARRQEPNKPGLGSLRGADLSWSLSKIRAIQTSLRTRTLPDADCSISYQLMNGS
jgi:hypothetical protein